MKFMTKPIVVAGLLWVFLLSCFSLGYLWADGDFHWLDAALIAVAGVGVWILIVSSRRAVPILLALALAVPSQAQLVEQPDWQWSEWSDSLNLYYVEPQAAVAVGAGIVVLCVGAYCVYRVASYCNRKFPKSTNSPNFSVNGDDGEYGASWNYGALGSCYSPEFTPASASTDTVTFTLNVTLEAGVVKTTMSTVSGEGTYQTWEEFRAEVASHGLVVSGLPDNSKYYSRDRQPCEAWAIPLAFDEETKTVKHESWQFMRKVTIERSMDLQTWTPFLNVEVGEWSGFQVIDTTVSGQMFYRVEVR